MKCSNSILKIRRSFFFCLFSVIDLEGSPSRPGSRQPLAARPVANEVPPGTPLYPILKETNIPAAEETPNSKVVDDVVIRMPEDPVSETIPTISVIAEVSPEPTYKLTVDPPEYNHVPTSGPSGKEPPPAYNSHHEEPIMEISAQPIIPMEIEKPVQSEAPKFEFLVEDEPVESAGDDKQREPDTDQVPEIPEIVVEAESAESSEEQNESSSETAGQESPAIVITPAETPEPVEPSSDTLPEPKSTIEIEGPAPAEREEQAVDPPEVSSTADLEAPADIPVSDEIISDEHLTDMPEPTPAEELVAPDTPESAESKELQAVPVENTETAALDTPAGTPEPDVIHVEPSTGTMPEPEPKAETGLESEVQPVLPPADIPLSEEIISDEPSTDIMPEAIPAEELEDPAAHEPAESKDLLTAPVEVAESADIDFLTGTPEPVVEPSTNIKPEPEQEQEKEQEQEQEPEKSEEKHVLSPEIATTETEAPSESTEPVLAEEPSQSVFEPDTSITTVPEFDLPLSSPPQPEVITLSETPEPMTESESVLAPTSQPATPDSSDSSKLSTPEPEVIQSEEPPVTNTDDPALPEPVESIPEQSESTIEPSEEPEAPAIYKPEEPSAQGQSVPSTESESAPVPTSHPEVLATSDSSKPSTPEPEVIKAEEPTVTNTEAPAFSEPVESIPEQSASTMEPTEEPESTTESESAPVPTADEPSTPEPEMNKPEEPPVSETFFEPIESMPEAPASPETDNFPEATMPHEPALTAEATSAPLSVSQPEDETSRPSTPEPELIIPEEPTTPEAPEPTKSSVHEDPPFTVDSEPSSFEPDEPLDLISEGVSNLELDHATSTEPEVSTESEPHESPETEDQTISLFKEASLPKAATSDEPFTHPDDIIPDLIYQDAPKETNQDAQIPLLRQSPPLSNDLLAPILETDEAIDAPQGDPMADSLVESVDLTISEGAEMPHHDSDGISNNLKPTETPPPPYSTLPRSCENDNASSKSSSPTSVSPIDDDDDDVAVLLAENAVLAESPLPAEASAPVVPSPHHTPRPASPNDGAFGKPPKALKGGKPSKS